MTIDDDIEDLNLKPGMSAEVTILADRKPDPVLTVPVDAVLGNVSMGRQRKCLVLTEAGIEECDIEIGMTNDSMAEVRTGLEEGDKVIRHPYKILSDADKVRFYGAGGAPKGNDWSAKGAKGGKGGMGKGMGMSRGEFPGQGPEMVPGPPEGKMPGMEQPKMGRGKGKPAGRTETP